MKDKLVNVFQITNNASLIRHWVTTTLFLEIIEIQEYLVINNNCTLGKKTNIF